MIKVMIDEDHIDDWVKREFPDYTFFEEDSWCVIDLRTPRGNYILSPVWDGSRIVTYNMMTEQEFEEED